LEIPDTYSSTISISDCELDINIDWDKLEIINDSMKYIINKNIKVDDNIFCSPINNNNGILNKILVSSVNTNTKPFLTIVDNKITNKRGYKDLSNKKNILDIYLIPKLNTKELSISYNSIIGIDEGLNTIIQSEKKIKIILD